MNLAVIDTRIGAPSSRELMERALDPYMLLGMPHLTPTGLSETWLMKELGHRHWIMLARHLQMENADFRTGDGGEAYASICATALRDADFSRARANDILEIRSSLTALSRNQHSSRHRLQIGTLSICDVEIVSAFIIRRRPGDNHALMRAEPCRDAPARYGESALAQRASAIRRGQFDAQTGLPHDGQATLLARLVPDAREDFNGAGLLYFAHFQRFFSGTLEAAMPGSFVGSRQREMFFLGNIAIGEAVEINLLRGPPDDARLLCNMVRQDGKVIAYASNGP
ncbi:Pnap_2097 family protein [Neorhizobium sp. JUb45]|uniref:Pnap_2097 family protein n=1 Tax=unclassified Neorhizobium TaxID=2629175 RepID=UPI001048840B|nr:Pnap_2097 family protein [Neorhizobium sp. JUb45]TCQ97958.1 putative biosynthetic protein (TIGR04099 family) [Neorhizobium sp. JUb45]